MIQQINLYQPMFRQQKKVFSAVTMLQIIGLFVFVLAAIYAYNLYKLKPFQADLKATNVEFARLNKHIELYEKKFPPLKKSKLLEDEIARMSRELKRRETIAKVLSSGSYGNTHGFSSYFEALARGYTKGAWLTDIRIGDGGKQVSLTGETVNPELVPVYIKKLSDSPVFRKKSFNELELSRMNKQPELVRFHIGTGS